MGLKRNLSIVNTRQTVPTKGVVAPAVRWLTIIFEAIPETKDIYAATGADIRIAIGGVKERIWILQTWLPGVSR